VNGQKKPSRSEPGAVVLRKFISFFYSSVSLKCPTTIRLILSNLFPWYSVISFAEENSLNFLGLIHLKGLSHEMDFGF
jgi:hypothetical protein